MEEFADNIDKDIDIEEHLVRAEADIENGRTRDAREVFKE